MAPGSDGLASHADSEGLALSLSGNDGVYMVPALTGLGAPHWSPSARGAIYGMTRDTSPAHLARAALESIAYQTYDLIEAMRADGIQPDGLRVDGGMVGNNWLMQFMANILDQQIDRPVVTETTAWGAAVLALLGSQQISTLEATAQLWKLEQTFTPGIETSARETLLAGWQTAVRRTLLDCE